MKKTTINRYGIPLDIFWKEGEGDNINNINIIKISQSTRCKTDLTALLSFQEIDWIEEEIITQQLHEKLLREA